MTPGPVLGLVTARGGSKRLPGKNLLDFDGRPLIEHTIAAARACPSITRIVVSTDDVAIADASRQAGAEVPFLRPPELATDAATSLDVVLHALDWLAIEDGWRPWAIALLQPTSPLRTGAHLSAAIAQLACQSPPASVLGVTTARPASWLYVVDETGQVSPLFSPGTAPAPAGRRRLVIPNGAIYVASVDFLRAQRGFVGPGTEALEMSAADSVDIDTADDFALALACRRAARG
jgi:CMP-N,N'-diacetyllegionaminic acid synthase